MSDEKQQLLKLSITKLRKKCKKLKISSQGGKFDMIERILHHNKQTQNTEVEVIEHSSQNQSAQQPIENNENKCNMEINERHTSNTNNNDSTQLNNSTDEINIKIRDVCEQQIKNETPPTDEFVETSKKMKNTPYLTSLQHNEIYNSPHKSTDAFQNDIDEEKQLEKRICVKNDSDEIKANNDNETSMHNTEDDESSSSSVKSEKIDFVNQCDDITQCESLWRLITDFNRLKGCNGYHRKFAKYFAINKHQIINDYHHVLYKHLNNDNTKQQRVDSIFQYIVEEFAKYDVVCNQWPCRCCKRNNREREKDENDIYASTRTATDILDTIHCFFMHSVDRGFVIIDNIDELEDDSDIDNDSNDNAYLDRHLRSLRKYLTSKLNQSCNVREISANNKFYTNLGELEQDKCDEKESKNSGNNSTKLKHDYYSFGCRFDCWSKVNEYNALDMVCPSRKISPKYKTLKKEILSNSVFHLEKNVFEEAYNKTIQLLNNSEFIKQINSRSEDQYGIKEGRPLNMERILSIILYTDYDDLQYYFSLQFRTEVTKKKANGKHEYYHWIKILTETVNCYGTKMCDSHVNVLYHGVSYLYFSKFVAVFCSPTSTTPNLITAARFAQNGFILELRPQASVSFFNVSPMSKFTNENERLFIQPPATFELREYQLRLKGIRNMRTNENYGHFMELLVVMQTIFQNFGEVGISQGAISQSIADEINYLMSSPANITEKRNPIYIQETFLNWSAKIYHIVLCKDMEEIYPNLIIFERLEDCIYSMIRFDMITNIFHNVDKIHVDGMGKIDVSWLMSLLSILKVVNSKLWSLELTHILNKLSVVHSMIAKCKKSYKENGWEIQRVSYLDEIYAIQIFRCEMP